MLRQVQEAIGTARIRARTPEQARRIPQSRCPMEWPSRRSLAVDHTIRRVSARTPDGSFPHRRKRDARVASRDSQEATRVIPDDCHLIHACCMYQQHTIVPARVAWVLAHVCEDPPKRGIESWRCVRQLRPPSTRRTEEGTAGGVDRASHNRCIWFWAAGSRFPQIDDVEYGRGMQRASWYPIASDHGPESTSPELIPSGVHHRWPTASPALSRRHTASPRSRVPKT